VLDRFRLNYRLSINDNGVQVDFGRPPAAFVSAVRDVVSLHGVNRGRIECKGNGSAARLRFTHGFPDKGRQAVRNVWQPPAAPSTGGNSRRSG
jgi:hypothetical protein